MQGRASNYCKNLVSYKFLLFLHLLLDIVTAISKLSLQFQDDKISISQLQDKVNTLLSSLEAFKVRPGKNLTSFQQEVGDGTQYKGLDLNRSGRDTFSRDDVIDKITAFLSDSFQGLSNDPILHAAATLTDHHSWPINNRQQMLTYGEDAIEVLSEHFEALLNQNHFNLQSCLDEWMEVKVHLHRERGELQYNNIDFWKSKFQMQLRYPNLLLVIKLCLVIPVQTACCERGN